MRDPEFSSDARRARQGIVAFTACWSSADAKHRNCLCARARTLMMRSPPITRHKVFDSDVKKVRDRALLAAAAIDIGFAESELGK